MTIPAPLLPRSVRWAVVGGVGVVIIYFSIIAPPPKTPLDIEFELIPLDKWRHFVAYAALGYALAYATTDWAWKSRRLAVFVIGVTILYGIGIEGAQSLLPQRYFSIVDAYANALGAILVIPYYRVRQYVDFEPLPLFLNWLVDRP